MTVTRLVVPHGSLVPGEVVVPAEAAHHARVARLEAGDPVELLDLDGHVGLGQVVAWEGGRCRVRVTSLLAERGEPPAPVVLGLGLLHTAAFDWAVEKATELGATDIAPVLTQRVQGRLARPRPARWQRLAAAAVAQCGRSRAPKVWPPLELPAFLTAASGFKVVADPQAPPVDVPFGAAEGGVTVLVGPEGGLTDEEVARACAAGFLRLRLGPRTLRAETAAVVALAVAQQRAGWW